MFESLKRLSSDDLRSHQTNLETNGFTVLTNAFDVSHRTSLLDELVRLESVRPGGDFPKSAFTGQVTRRWTDLLNEEDLWQHVATHPWLMQVLPLVLGENFLLSTINTAVIGPGEPAQPIHVDDAIYGFPRPHHTIMVTVLWALTNFTEEVGATRIVPGSNKWKDDPDFGKHYDSIPMEMPAGSIGMLLGSCYHGSGANLSNKDRPALLNGYIRGSMRQQENFMLGIRHERMMTFSKELQDILGFKQYGVLGAIFGMRPRVELERHYPNASADDPYFSIRNSFHTERISGEIYV